MQHGERLVAEPPELHNAPVDIGGFLSGEPFQVSKATHLVDEACKKHGLFLVVNHGVDSTLLAKAVEFTDFFYAIPLAEKRRVKRKMGDRCGIHYGYASSFTGRFTSKHPWKETLTFPYSSDGDNPTEIVEKYFLDVHGDKFGFG
ncbi:hypothetical protein Nepgr_024341 [Nepenthes gracilis]|uniref:Non-haem dioxygenase N-terminal domain-containing protein n=1 Tax=Nepenthes gracilis TaxID=150966 RepID=A0AAD3XYQ1_NEPGR|nr:hypothetical protein Nepgr_024341 [Nepenthes gracilis]